MRQKRAKAYRKLMALYSMTFGFRKPYQVLSKPLSSIIFVSQLLKVVVDSEMCKSAHQGNMDLSNLLTTVLQGAVKLSAYLPLSTIHTRLNGSFQVK
jgi:U3 small nucleolar RNA-associated protein 23